MAKAPTLAQELRTLRKLKLDLDRKSKAKTEAEKKHKAAQARLFARMEDEEIGSTRVAGTLFTPTETLYANVQDKEAFLAWAKEEDEQLLEEKPREGLLNALVRQCLEDDEELPPGVGFYPRQYISQRSS